MLDGGWGLGNVGWGMGVGDSKDAGVQALQDSCVARVLQADTCVAGRRW